MIFVGLLDILPFLTENWRCPEVKGLVGIICRSIFQSFGIHSLAKAWGTGISTWKQYFAAVLLEAVHN